ncbi:hypothetical protein C2845_PM13G22710 [Panicum miliaceum]|uniref:Uncharacterized protein n=1 Tax=Panicum miliaceum TaxID=4540 RepID=A0A3L6RHP8_PANMI|nr:hypothetical protein C2845_PM13G22710 [Panicum miliaceum]
MAAAAGKKGATKRPPLELLGGAALPAPAARSEAGRDAAGHPCSPWTRRCRAPPRDGCPSAARSSSPAAMGVAASICTSSRQPWAWAARGGAGRSSELCRPGAVAVEEIGGRARSDGRRRRVPRHGGR